MLYHIAIRFIVVCAAIGLFWATPAAAQAQEELNIDRLERSLKIFGVLYEKARPKGSDQAQREWPSYCLVVAPLRYLTQQVEQDLGAIAEGFGAIGKEEIFKAAREGYCNSIKSNWSSTASKRIDYSSVLETLDVFATVIASPEVDNPVKARFFYCAHENSIKDISDRADRISRIRSIDLSRANLLVRAQLLGEACMDLLSDDIKTKLQQLRQPPAMEPPPPPPPPAPPPPPGLPRCPGDPRCPD